MGRKSYFEINKDKILFEFSLPPYYFSNKNIVDILNNLKEESLVSESMYFNEFLNALIEEGLMSHTIKIKDHYYTRYSFEKEFDPFKFGTNLTGNKSFLSMTTALNFSGLTSYREELIFVSHELTQKTNLNKTLLQQSSIDKAFTKTMPRYTNNVGEYDTLNYILLNPKFSNNYEVHETIDGIKYSSINRALVEMIVNIHYFKTSEIIIDIFRPLKKYIDVKKVYKLLKKMDYIYPYFQSLGYFLEEIGFNKNELNDFKNKAMNIDFYTQKMKPELVGENYKYNKYWKIYY